MPRNLVDIGQKQLADGSIQIRIEGKVVTHLRTSGEADAFMAGAQMVASAIANRALALASHQHSNGEEA